MGTPDLLLRAGQIKKGSKIKKALDLLRHAGMMRPRDLKRFDIPLDYLWQLERRGLVVRLGRGLYALPDQDLTEHHSLAETCMRVPNGVVCLLSALRFHGLTSEAPFEVWIAIDPKARLPRQHGTPLRIVRFSGEALAAGVGEHRIEGVAVRVYNPAKTVADCFKYRNKIGIDVAIEALRDCRRERKAANDELWRYAKVCRVANVMTPYLESTT